MPLYRPSELKALLDELGTAPHKRFSQNFLIDGNVIRKIADFADVQEGDNILEIGPGPGALTEELLLRKARVLAVEKDRVLAAKLSDLPGDLTVITDDILKCPLESLIENWKTKDQIKVVANLPYHITTPILTLLTPQRSLISDIVVMVQEEVARRYTSPPGSREYGSISLFLNYWAKLCYGFKVKPTSFYPPPKVESAVIKLSLKEPPALSDETKFFEMTRSAFGQRRKMLKVSLKSFLTPYAIEKLGPILHKRPEELGLDEFVALFKVISE